MYLRKPPSSPDVGVAVRADRVHHRAGAEEQARLEERVREHVEEAGRERAAADGREHEAELAHRGVRQHLLDVVLHAADRRGEQRGQRADHGDHGHRRAARARTPATGGRSGTRPTSPSWRRGSARETGVGPAIASGSHTYSGICALLPVQPRNKNSVATRRDADAAPSENAARQRDRRRSATRGRAR